MAAFGGIELRLPYELDQRVKAAAERRGVATSTLVREWISSS